MLTRPISDTLLVGKLRLHTYVSMKMKDGPSSRTGTNTDAPCVQKDAFLQWCFSLHFERDVDSIWSVQLSKGVNVSALTKIDSRVHSQNIDGILSLISGA